MRDIRSYELWLRAAGYRPDTMARAVRVAQQYLSWADGRNPADKDSVVEFLADASERVKRVTMLNYHKDLALLFRFAVSEGRGFGIWSNGFPSTRPSLNERERDTRFLPYTDEEFAALLEVCHRWHWLGARDRALLSVLHCQPGLDTGHYRLDRAERRTP